VVVRTPALLTPTTTEHVLLPSGREEFLPKATPRFPKWRGEFPWSTYGGKPILDLHGELLYAEFVILRLLEAQGWSGVWVNHVHRDPFPTRCTPSPIKILPPSNLLDLLDRIYARTGKRSGPLTSSPGRTRASSSPRPSTAARTRCAPPRRLGSRLPWAKVCR